jgi:hypothetical protein
VLQRRSATFWEAVRSRAYHYIDNEDGDVTERAATSSEVGERLVTRGVDNEQTGDVVLCFAVLVQHLRLLLDSIHGEERGTNLLGDSAGFALLHVGLTNLCVREQ